MSEDGTFGRVDGGGHDDVGEFVLSGTYEGVRLMLAKTYVRGTGDPKENKGHTVKLRLTLTDLHEVVPECTLAPSSTQSAVLLQNEQLPLAEQLSMYGAPPGSLGFFGTWHVRTWGYDGDAEMTLWLPRGLEAVPAAFKAAPPLSERIGGRLSALKELKEAASVLKQPLLGAPAARPLKDQFEDRVDALRDAHPGKSTAELRAMARTVVATPGGVPEDLLTYTVGVGDTLASIALRHGMRVDQIRRWNKLFSSDLYAGLTLFVRPPTKPPHS